MEKLFIYDNYAGTIILLYKVKKDEVEYTEINPYLETPYRCIVDDSYIDKFFAPEYIRACRKIFYGNMLIVSNRINTNVISEVKREYGVRIPIVSEKVTISYKVNGINHAEEIEGQLSIRKAREYAKLVKADRDWLSISALH